MLALGALVGLLTIGLICLLLIVLTLMRETMNLRSEVKVLTGLITQPPVPTFLGNRIPEVLARRFDAMNINRQVMPVIAVLFFKRDCEGCHILAKEVQMAIGRGRITRECLWVIVEAYDDDPILHMSEAMSDVVVRDDNGAFRSACEVLGTPTIFAVRPDTLQLLVDRHG